MIVSMSVFAGCTTVRLLRRVSKNLTTYSMDVVFCDDEKKLSVVQQVEYVNNTSCNLTYLCFNLYGMAFSENATIKPYSKTKIDECFPNGVNYGDMIIKAVAVDNRNVDVLLVGEDNNALKVELINELKKNERVDITIEYELYLANCAHRLGYNAGKVNLGNWYPIVAVFENGEFNIEPYYSNGDPFYSEVANYDVSIAYSESYTLLSTGNLIYEDQGSGVKKSSYSALAVRDFAMVLLSDAEIRTGVIEDVEVSVFSSAGDENIDIYLETAKRSIQLFGELYGRYPYKSLNVVFTDFYQGGMEYPNLVYISTSIKDLTETKKVIVHEIAHQWWYGIVGNNEISDAWFDEGLAEYSTLLYFENYVDEGVDSRKLIDDAVTSYELYLDVIKSLNLGINYSMELSLDEYSTEYEYVYMIYVKGLLFFQELRNVLGDEEFFECLKNIYDEYKFKIINKEKFILIIEETSGMVVTELIEGWLSGRVDVSQ